MGKVAKTFNVTLPATTQIVDRLVQKHFLIRGDHPADRRVYILELTRQGKALVQELRTMQKRGVEQVLARMTAADRGQVIHGLEALVDAATEAAKR